MLNLILKIQMTGLTNMLKSGKKLTKIIENLYSNKYLLTLNDNWQQQIDKLSTWTFKDVNIQRNFFNQYIYQNCSKNSKLFVIISDALRYEIGDELVSLIRQEDRFDAKFNFAMSSIPSYTQLGMASLLPNKELSIIINEATDSKNAPVFVDGMNSTGKD